MLPLGYPEMMRAECVRHGESDNPVGDEQSDDHTEGPNRHGQDEHQSGVVHVHHHAVSVALDKLEPMAPDSLLAFEARWPRHNGTKDLAIRHDLGITPARFYQLLGRAAKTSEGIAADPITARRVRERSAGIS